MCFPFTKIIQLVCVCLYRELYLACCSWNPTQPSLSVYCASGEGWQLLNYILSDMRHICTRVSCKLTYFVLIREQYGHVNSFHNELTVLKCQEGLLLCCGMHYHVVLCCVLLHVCVCMLWSVHVLCNKFVAEENWLSECHSHWLPNLIICHLSCWRVCR